MTINRNHSDNSFVYCTQPLYNSVNLKTPTKPNVAKPKKADGTENSVEIRQIWALRPQRSDLPRSSLTNWKFTDYSNQNHAVTDETNHWTKEELASLEAVIFPEELSFSSSIPTQERVGPSSIPAIKTICRSGGRTVPEHQKIPNIVPSRSVFAENDSPKIPNIVRRRFVFAENDSPKTPNTPRSSTIPNTFKWNRL